MKAIEVHRVKIVLYQKGLPSSFITEFKRLHPNKWKACTFPGFRWVGPLVVHFLKQHVSIPL